MENYKIQKAKCGLRTLVVKRPKNPTMIDINLELGIGSDLESGSNLELGHFLEHLFVSLTSTKYPNSLENREVFSTNSIKYTASVGNKNTSYEFSLDKKLLPMFLDMLVHAIFDFRVDKEIFDKEKNSIIEELNDIINDIAYPLETHTDAMIYRGHSREISEKIRLNNTKKIKPKDVEKHWKTYYKLPYMIIAIYGSVDIKKINDLLDTLSKGLVTKNKIHTKHRALSIPKLYKEFNLKNESRILYTHKPDKISSIKIQWRLDFNKFSDEYYRLSCLDFVMINDLNSLLLKKLRGEYGLIYDIESNFSLDEFQNSLSFYSFETSVASHKILKVVEAFLEVIEYLTKNKIKLVNFNKYMTYQKHTILSRNECLDHDNILSNYAEAILFNQPVQTQTQEDKKYLGITREEVKQVAKKVFNTNNLYISYSNPKNLNREIDTIITPLDF